MSERNTDKDSRTGRIILSQITLLNAGVPIHTQYNTTTYTLTHACMHTHTHTCKHKHIHKHSARRAQEYCGFARVFSPVDR